MTDLRDRLGRVAGARSDVALGNRDGVFLREPALGTREGAFLRERALISEASRPFTVIEEHYAIDDLGLAIVGRGATDPLMLAHLGLRGPAPSQWREVLFLDTETTGLSGGTGTYVFLLGTAWIADGELVLRQHLLEDLGAEREFIGALAEELDRFRACASYNGKCFDLPLLRTRVIMALRSDLAVDDSHLDLLHPARRMWRSRLGSVSLRNVEDGILDDAREDDIPGSLIPERFFRYLQTGDTALIAPVLRHNARDVISLVRVADRIAQDVRLARDGRAPADPAAAFSMARVFERAGEPDAAFKCYESAYADAHSELRVRLALPYARAKERRGDAQSAVRMLETLLDLGLGAPRWRAQAESRIRRLSRKRGPRGGLMRPREAGRPPRSRLPLAG